LEQAEARYERAHEPELAARAALLLCREHFIRNRIAEAGGWLGRAARLLEGLPECAAHGYLRWTFGRAAWAGDDIDTALSCAREASALGRRFGDVDLEALALHDEGHVLIARGDVERGRQLIDEAAALGAGVAPLTAGMVYCGAIWAYRNMGDWRRASEWTDTSLRWCERESVTGYPGLCRFHRAEVRRVRGEFASAEQDALEAVDELRLANPSAATWALTELGEIRRRRGDTAGASEAFGRSSELGGVPQPGQALLKLEQGKAADALAGITDALSGMVGVGREDRASILPAGVTIAIAADRLDLAGELCTELESWASSFETTATSAAAANARGEVQLASGEPELAVTSLRRAWRLWCDLEAPFEAARTRVLLADAHRALGNESNAVTELEAARAGFERIGAARELARVRSRITARRLPTMCSFMFTDIVDSTKLVEALGDEAWSSLLSWHDRTLRDHFQKAQGHEVNHEGDGFFISFPDAVAALDCAVTIQRALAQHRHDHGFAPSVRIGVHAAEALELDGDYLGKGVHEAARIGAAAAGGEILATESVIAAAAGRYPTGELRLLELKGLATPLVTTSVDWH
jgi:class 3 adenylate cyclase